MQCSKCGTNNPESSRFCMLCGKEFTLPNKVFTYQQNVVVNTSQAEIAEKESIYVALDTEQYNQILAPEAQIVQPKKRFPQWILLAIISSILVVMAVLVFWLYPSIKRAIIGPEVYYALAEKEYAEEKISHYTKYMKATTNMPLNLDLACRFTVENLDGNFAKFEELLNLSELNFTMKNDPDNNRYQSELFYRYNDETFAHLLMQEKEDRIGFSFPDISKKQYVMKSVRAYYKLLARDEIELQRMTGLDQQELDKLIKEIYTTVIGDSIPKANIKNDTQEYHGKKLKTTTIIIDNAVLKTCYDAFAKELETNERLKSVIKNSIQYSDGYQINGSGKALTQADVDQMYENIIKQYEDSADEVKLDSNIHITAFYNSRGKLVAREIADANKLNKILIGEFENNQQDCFEIVMKNEDFSITLLDARTTSNGIVTGKMTIRNDSLSSEEEPKILVDYSYEENGKIDGIPMFIGKAEIKVGLLTSQEDQVLLVIENKKATKDTMNVSVQCSYEQNGKTTKLGMQGVLKMSSFPDLQDFDVPKESTMTQKSMNDILEQISQKIINALGLDEPMDDFSETL